MVLPTEPHQGPHGWAVPLPGGSSLFAPLGGSSSDRTGGEAYGSCVIMSTCAKELINSGHWDVVELETAYEVIGANISHGAGLVAGMSTCDLQEQGGGLHPDAR